ncbi:unnamed protein product [Urochloa humidicola]
MSLLRFTGALGLDSQLDGLLSEATAEEDFTGKAEQSVVLRLAGQDFKRLSLIGLGQSAPSTAAVASESTAGILARTSWREPSSVARRLVPMFAGFRARCSAREGVARIRANVRCPCLQACISRSHIVLTTQVQGRATVPN